MFIYYLLAVVPASQNPQIDPTQFFTHTLQLITLVIGIGVGILTVMSFLGHRSINAQRDRLENEITQLRAELRTDTQRLQDQVERRISRIDVLLDKFDAEAKAKLDLLEKKGGIIQESASSAQRLELEMRQASEKAERLLAEFKAKFDAQTEEIMARVAAGKTIGEGERSLLATREAEIIAKETDNRTAKDWFSLGAARFSSDDYEETIKYLELALEKGLPAILEITAREQIGTSYRYLGNYQRAYEEFKKQYELAQKRRDIRSMVSGLNGMSKMQALLRNLDEALRLNAKAIGFLKLPNAFSTPWVLYYNKALIHKLRDHEEDRQEYKEALKTLKEYEVDDSWRDLMARDAAEFDMLSHPQLGELFSFCDSIPKKAKKAEESIIKKFLEARIVEAARADKPGRQT